MAAELKITLLTMTYTKGVIAINIKPLPSPLVIDQTGENTIHDVITLVSSPATPLSRGNITTIGWIYIKNLDVTNTVFIGTDALTFMIMLKPNEYALLRWNAPNIWGKTDAGSAIIEYLFVED
jgi:hypothetical protein